MPNLLFFILNIFYGVVMGLTACFVDHTPQLAMQPKTAEFILGPKPRNESNTFLKPEETIWRSRYTRNNSGGGPLCHGEDNVTNTKASPFTETTATYWFSSNVWKVKPTAALAEMCTDRHRKFNSYLVSFYFNLQCAIYIFYFNNIYIVVTSTCFDTFVSSSGSSKVVHR